MDAQFDGAHDGQVPVPGQPPEPGQAPPPAPEPPADTRRVATPREAYLLTYGTDEEKARLRAEVREVRPQPGTPRAAARAPRPRPYRKGAVKDGWGLAFGITCLVTGIGERGSGAGAGLSVQLPGAGRLRRAFRRTRQRHLPRAPRAAL
jgi:hypothetical protein